MPEQPHPTLSAPHLKYQTLMETIRERLDVVATLRSQAAGTFSAAETAAFQGRKIIEGTAFACLLAIENGLKHVPKDAAGHWNAQTILHSLKKKGIEVLPNPSVLRKPTAMELAENPSIAWVGEGVREKCLTVAQLVEMYGGFHKWLHEINPYQTTSASKFLSAYGASLWLDLAKLEDLLGEHLIGIKGQQFYCSLRGGNNGHTTVFSLSKQNLSGGPKVNP